MAESGNVEREAGTTTLTRTTIRWITILVGEAMFTAAQRAGHVGSWERDLATDKIMGSDELYRLCGLVLQSVEKVGTALGRPMGTDVAARFRGE